MDDKHRPLFIHEDGSVELKDEPKNEYLVRDDIPTPPTFVNTEKQESSSEFDEAIAQAEVKRLEELTEKDFLREHPQQDPLGGNYYDGMDNNKESEAFIDGARFQHAKDAEKIADWIARDKYSQKVRTDQAEQIAELTEENQRLREQLTHYHQFHESGKCQRMIDDLVVERKKLTAALKSLRHAIVGHKGNGEVIPMIDEALAADGGENV